MTDIGQADSPLSPSRREALKFAGALALGGAAVLAAGAAGPGAAEAAPPNRFSVEIDGVLVAGIEAVESLESETEVKTFVDGSNPNLVHALPGQNKPGRVKVTKDWSNTHEFFTWRQTVLNGNVERKSMSIVFHDDNSADVTRINLYQCWPVKWEGPELDNAKNSGHATEKLEIVWETIELKSA